MSKTQDGAQIPSDDAQTAHSNGTEVEAGHEAEDSHEAESPSAERRRLIALDDGNPEETVYVVSGAASKDSSYHNDRDCRYLRRATTCLETTREAAQKRERPPCRRCVDGLVEQDRDSQITDCPLCGETVGDIPAHLPCDGEQDGESA